LRRRWLFVPWEFAKFNLLAGGSAQYGSHAWHWNLTQGFPTVAASLLPLGLAGVALTDRHTPFTSPEHMQLEHMLAQAMLAWLKTSADHPSGAGVTKLVDVG